MAAAGQTVISRWSDGALVAIDAATGRVAWRAEGPPAPGYSGHRTGAGTVWRPPGMHVAAGAVVVTGGSRLAAYEVSTGARRWSTTVPAGCTDGFTSAAGQYACATGAWNVATGRPDPEFPAGPYQPLGCAVAVSACTGLRDGAGHGWFVDGPVPRRVPDLDRPTGEIAAGLVFYREADRLWAAEPDGRRLRSYSGRLRVLGADGTHVLLLTPGRYLHEVDPRSGARLADFPLRTTKERALSWDPGQVQIVDGYLAVERLRRTTQPDPTFPTITTTRLRRWSSRRRRAGPVDRVGARRWPPSASYRY